VVTIDPEFATETDSIIVTFNAAEATRDDLVGYTGTVYTHTGVQTQIGGAEPIRWQHVIGNWGINSTQPALTRIGTDIYQLVIPNPRDFYGVTNPAERITELNFVFRSSDASLQTEDIFVSLFEEGLSIKLLEPTSLPIYPEPNEEITISFTADEPDSMFLIYGNNIIEQTTNDTLTYVLNTEGSGRQWITIFAKKDEETASDSFYFFVREPVSVADLPSEVEPGINYIDANTVTLVLYAPNKNFVYLTGDFNEWLFDPDEDLSWLMSEDYYMNITPDSTTYWKTITGLTAKQEYRFQYLVDGNLQIADPYADKILESEDDEIHESVYPNLIEYPSDKTSFSVSVFQTDQDEYEWGVTDFERPAKEELVIYELFVRDFVSTHSYQTLIDTLSYLETLGVSAIELMPINEFEGNSSWGYNPSFYFAPDKYYGTKNDLKKFIDECHRRGIAVIQDIVLNHTYGSSSFVRLYASSDSGPPTEDNPWYNKEHNFQNPDAQWGNDFNHESLQTQKLVDRILNYWITEFKIDGFRFDFTKGFGNNIKSQSSDPWGSLYDADRIRLLKRMVDQMWSQDSTVYAIFEHLAEDSEEQELANYGILMWGNLNYNYNEATMGYHDNDKSNFYRISWKNHSGFTGPFVVGYMESHDEERLMYKNLTYGNSSGSYNVQNLLTALQRMKMAAAFFFTVPGPKMIWQFGELGYDFSIDYNGRLGEKPIRWNYFEEPARKKLYDVYSALINLRKEYDIFKTEDFQLSVAASRKRIQLNSDTLNITIIGNFGVTAGTISPNFQSSGKWYDFFTGDSIDVVDSAEAVTLEPGEFHIYSDKKLTTPGPDIITKIKDNDGLPAEFTLFQNYPNPFNPTTTIKFNIPNVVIRPSLAGKHGMSLRTTLKIYDILGKEITTLINENKSPGYYEVIFDARNLSSGVYFYRLEAGQFIETKKMLLLR
jgi:1,4-alpha-glucan branching enzyme